MTLYTTEWHFKITHCRVTFYTTKWHYTLQSDITHCWVTFYTAECLYTPQSIAPTLPFFKKGFLFCPSFFVSALLKKGIFGKKVLIKGVSRTDSKKSACYRCIQDQFLPKKLFTRHLAGYLNRFTPLFSTSRKFLISL